MITTIELLANCSSDSNGSSNLSNSNTDPTPASNSEDIANATFTKVAGSCTNYAGVYHAEVNDIQQSDNFVGIITITDNGSDCTLTSNAIPNHDFNDQTAHFATNVSYVDQTFTIPANPTFAGSATSISLSTDNGVMLNGVKLDMLSAGCYGVGNGSIGCNDLDTPYRYDPLSTTSKFGADAHNAHTQPSGTYHYHGSPKLCLMKAAR